MQASLPAVVGHPFAASRRIKTAAAILAATAAAGGVVLIAGDDESGTSSVTPAAATGGASDLSAYDGALLHHHGIEVPRDAGVTPEPTSSQRAAAERFHHFR